MQFNLFDKCVYQPLPSWLADDEEGSTDFVSFLGLELDDIVSQSAQPDHFQDITSAVLGRSVKYYIAILGIWYIKLSWKFHYALVIVFILSWKKNPYNSALWMSGAVAYG